MRLSLDLALKPIQTLKLTPQLKQAIRLLELGQLELEEAVSQEIASNLFLEPSAAEGVAHKDEGSESDLGKNTPTRDETGAEPQESGLSSATGEFAAPRTESAESAAFQRQGRVRRHLSQDDDSARPSSWIESLAEEVDFHQALARQIQLEFADQRARALALALSDQLDESGYLRLDTAAFAAGHGYSAYELQEVLTRLQHLEPPGIFARSLEECLRLQLLDRDALDGPMEKLLGRLDLLQKGDLKALARIGGLTDEGLKARLTLLRSLDPKPAERFQTQRLEPRIADLILSSRATGDWSLELNPEALPRFFVNSVYFEELMASCRRKEDKDFLKGQHQSATWFFKAVQQRYRTLLATAEAIFTRQADFVRRGPLGLKSMTMQELATDLGLHESTISRIVRGKYVATPFGIFELRYFFASGLESQDGESLASHSVQARIKALVAEEKADHILSDEEILAHLQKEGIILARRTVAKYRQFLKIPGSAARRRQKHREQFLSSRT